MKIFAALLVLAAVALFIAYVAVMGFWYTVAMASTVAGLTATLLWASGHE